jgi:class 3 adenylate cyclase/tetratricopeptide (TPR) repeat protein
LVAAVQGIEDWLKSIGLGEYAQRFVENGVDLSTLPDLTEEDLKELGVLLGHRRKLLRAIGVLHSSALSASPSSLPADSTAERRQLTVMFTDLVGSTRLSTMLDPEEMRDIIAQYQRVVSQAIARFGGYVAKPLGDGLLIYFGWPHAHEDDAARALRAAFAALDAVRTLRTPSGEGLAARAGVATGEVVVGDFIGAGVDESGAVVGETPNLAARLQSLGGANVVVVSDATRKLVGNQFAFTDLGEVGVSGFKTPVCVWRLDAERASESRFHALHGGRLGKLIGRDHEVGSLLDRWGQACEGERQLVLISGEAGIGKSRLVAEVVQRSAAEQRILYQASPLHTNTALYPVLRQLEVKAGFTLADASAERLRKLADVVRDKSALDRAALAYVASLMSLGEPTQGVSEQPLPPAEVQRDAALDALVEQAVAAAATLPLLIVFEDAHWLDATTLEFVGRLLAGLEGHKAMILVTYRPEFVPPWTRHANGATIMLSRLGRRDALAIVGSRMPEGQTLPPQVAADIVAKSDGVPLFVEELTGSVIEAGYGEGGPTFQIPATLRDALTERLDRLGSAKEVAQIGATLGREFSLDTLAMVLGRTKASLQNDLDQLLSIEIVFQSARTDHRYVFKHALLQDAAYKSMLKSRRRELHARIVDVLPQLRPDIAETEPEVLANHLEQAGRTAEAAAYWRKAGKISLQKSAYREAIGAFSNALRLDPQGSGTPLERIDTNRAIATAYFAIADIQSVHRHLDQAIREASTTDNKLLVAEIGIQQCHVLNIFGGRIADARAAGEPALLIATERGDDQLAYGARFALGQACWAAGDYRKGVTLLTPNLPENLSDPDRIRDFATAGSLMIDSLATLGTCHSQLGEFDRAFAIFDKANELLNQIQTTAFDHMVMGSHPSRALLLRGEWEPAIPMLEKNRKLCIEAGMRFSVPWQTGFLGHARVMAGEVEAGIALLEEALRDCPAVYFSAIIRIFLAEARLARGESAAAIEMASENLRLSRDLGYRAHEAESLRVLGAALASVDLAQAENSVRQALHLSVTLGLRPEQAHGLRVLSDIHRRAAAYEAASESRCGADKIYSELKMALWARPANDQAAC